jgi:hypothetical protein
VSTEERLTCMERLRRSAAMAFWADTGLCGEDEKLFGCRKTVQDLNTPASGGPTSAVQVIRRFDSNAACGDRRAQRYRLVAGIA